MLDDDHIDSDSPHEPARGLSRGIVLGCYDGLRAGEAIVAVRGLGLRPCLERVEGYESELHGFVVSQEPASGAGVAADSQVFLYVAAPARAVVTPTAPAEEELVEEASDYPEPGDDDRAGAEGSGDDGRSGEDWQEEGEREGQGEGFEECADAEQHQPGFQEPKTRELVPEPPEDSPVWRGGAPGMVPRRRGRRPISLGPQLALIALFACGAVTLLVVLAGQGHRSPVRTRRPRASHVGLVAAPAPRASARPVFRRGVSPAARPRPVARVGAVRVAVPGPSAPEPGPGVASGTGESAEEHAVREFGP